MFGRFKNKRVIGDRKEIRSVPKTKTKPKQGITGGTGLVGGRQDLDGGHGVQRRLEDAAFQQRRRFGPARARLVAGRPHHTVPVAVPAKWCFFLQFQSLWLCVGIVVHTGWTLRDLSFSSSSRSYTTGRACTCDVGTPGPFTVSNKSV